MQAPAENCVRMRILYCVHSNLNWFKDGPTTRPVDTDTEADRQGALPQGGRESVDCEIALSLSRCRPNDRSLIRCGLTHILTSLRAVPAGMPTSSDLTGLGITELERGMFDRFANLTSV